MEVKDVIHRAALKLGYGSLRGRQEIILAFAGGSDVFVSLPTGSGKSLCYSILPWLFDTLFSRENKSIINVISPLVSLMLDQVRAFKERNLSSICLSNVDDKLNEDVCDGCYQVVFMSPEALLVDTERRDMLLNSHFQKNLVGLIVDEAHCVKKW